MFLLVASGILIVGNYSYKCRPDILKSLPTLYCFVSYLIAI